MSVSAWIPQLVWRIGWWWTPDRWVQGTLRRILPGWVFTAPWPTGPEQAIVLGRLLAGLACLAIGLQALLDNNFVVASRQWVGYWATLQPKSMTAWALNSVVLPNLVLWCWAWVTLHLCVGFALALGLLVPTSLLLLMAVHGTLMVLCLGGMPHMALAHGLVWVIAPILWAGQAGLHWGLDYWRTPSAALSKAGISRAGITQTGGRKRTPRHKALRPQPDMDDDDDGDTHWGAAFRDSDDDDD